MIATARNFLIHRLCRVQRISRLVDVRQHHSVTNPHRSAGRLFLPHNHAKQRRLPGTVGTNDSDDPALRQVEIHILEDHRFAERLAQILGSNNHITERLTGRNLNLRGSIPSIVLLLLKFFVPQHASFILRGSGFRGHPNPLQFTSQFPLPSRLASFFKSHPLVLLLKPRRVIAFVRNPFATLEFQDPAGNIVEEVPIVSNGDNRAGEISKVLFEPTDRLGVQMVRWFVQQQNVRILQKQLTQRDSSFFATGKASDDRVAWRDFHRVGSDVDTPVQLPQVQDIDLVLNLRLFFEHFLHFFGRQLFAELHVELVVSIENRSRFGHAFFDALVDGLLGIQSRLLRKVSDLNSLRRPDFAFVFLVLTRHDAKQRALSSTVVPQHADLGARIERQPNLTENHFFVVKPSEVLDRHYVIISHVSDFPMRTYSAVRFINVRRYSQA